MLSIVLVLTLAFLISACSFGGGSGRGTTVAEQLGARYQSLWQNILAPDGEKIKSFYSKAFEEHLDDLPRHLRNPGRRAGLSGTVDYDDLMLAIDQLVTEIAEDKAFGALYTFTLNDYTLVSESGDVAVMTYILTLMATYEGQGGSDIVGMRVTWRKESGQWRIISEKAN